MWEVYSENNKLKDTIQMLFVEMLERAALVKGFISYCKVFD